MKSFNLVGLFVIMAFLLSACDKSKKSVEAPISGGPQQQLGGISVGNGLSTYTSELGFSFRYNSSLDLELDANQNIQLSSRRFDSAESVSVLTFQTLQTAKTQDVLVEDAEELLDLARSLGAKGEIQEKEMSSGHRLDFILEEAAMTKKTASLFLAPSGLLILATSLLQMNGQGAEIVRAVPETLEFDVTPPTVESVKVVKPQVQAGERIELLIEIKDDLSGIAPFPILLFEHEDSEMDIIVGLNEPLEPVEGDLYRWSLEVPAWQRSGTYFLTQMRFSDRSRNLRLYSLERGDGGDLEYFTIDTNLVAADEEDDEAIFLLVNRESSRVQLGKLAVQIQNSGAQDLSPPQIDSVEILTPEVQAGSFLQVLVKASDDVSGVDPTSLFATIAERGSYRLEDYPIYSVEEIAEGEFLVQFAIGSRFPAGDYRLESVSIADRAGKRINEVYSDFDFQRLEDVEVLQADGSIKVEQQWFDFKRLTRSREYFVEKQSGSRYFSTEELDYEYEELEELPPFEFRVLNEDVELSLGPILKSIRITPQIQPGGQGSITIELENDAELFSKGLQFLFDSEDEAIIEDAALFSVLRVDGELHRSGEREYRYDFVLGEDVRPGHYVINGIFMSDTAGNTLMYWAYIRGKDGLFNVISNAALFSDWRLSEPGSVISFRKETDRFYRGEHELEDDFQTDVPVLVFEVRD